MINNYSNMNEIEAEFRRNYEKSHEECLEKVFRAYDETIRAAYERGTNSPPEDPMLVIAWYNKLCFCKCGKEDYPGVHWP